ncbi:hypothetical protein [Okeania sp. SIO2C2]|uniref:hypothetical protein n=1 Tax=Okeania sp. SIO2C2 TaxID=2607787 RepID=UPI002579EE83|nr:hypothetical protein [Okeania sp. SIO2C2]
MHHHLIFPIVIVYIIKKGVRRQESGVRMEFLTTGEFSFLILVFDRTLNSDSFSNTIME